MFANVDTVNPTLSPTSVFESISGSCTVSGFTADKIRATRNDFETALVNAFTQQIGGGGGLNIRVTAVCLLVFFVISDSCQF